MTDRTRDVVNLPNMLTAVRILLVPFYLVALLYHRFELALGFFVVASVTDLLDGMAARMRKQFTRFGEVLDPIADKLLLMSSFVVFALLGWVPPWLAVAVLSRDIIVLCGTLILYLTTGVLTIAVTFPGKVTTVLQVLQLAYILLLVNLQGEVRSPLALNLAVLVLTVFSGVQYVMKGLKLANG